MKKTTLLDQLREFGYDVEEVVTVKNGLRCQGIRVMTDGNISPVVYYSQEDTLADMVHRIDRAMEWMPGIDLEGIRSKEGILDRVYLAIQKQSDENLLKKTWMDLELYVRVRVDGFSGDEFGSFKLNPDTMLAGITVEEVWNAAERNTKECSYDVRSLAAILGLPDDLNPCPMYVCQSLSGHDGATALYFPQVFAKFCKKYGTTGCYILPSSTEELILIPESECQDAVPEELAMMVADVNAGVVEEKLQLQPSVYFYDGLTDVVKILATYGGY